MRNNTKQ